MTRSDTLAALQRREPELRRLGIMRLAIFGSTARGEEGPTSDVDLVAALDPNHPMGAFEFVRLEQHLQEVLGTKVDLVTEPARRPRFQAEIDRDRVVVF